MSSSKFTIIKQCEECSGMFETQRRTTKFCSHKCNQKNYKRRKRLELVSEVEKEQQKTISKPKVRTVNFDLIREKEFLTVKEVAFLFECSKNTIYRMIEDEEINAVNLRKRLTRIRRIDIEALFSKPKQQEKSKAITINNCYLMPEIIEKYRVSKNTIYNYGKKHNIERLKQNGKTYYSKHDIDKLFSQ